jgi:hypothetical protein
MIKHKKNLEYWVYDPEMVGQQQQQKKGSGTFVDQKSVSDSSFCLLKKT